MQVGDGNQERARSGDRQIWFDGPRIATPIYWRDLLAPGDQIVGPAIIEEFGSTIPIHPGFKVRVDAFGNLIVTKESE